jgi:hypothetical protein
MMLRSGIRSSDELQENASRVHICGIMRSASTSWSRLVSTSTSKASHSPASERAIPNSRRPSLMWSSIAPALRGADRMIDLEGREDAGMPEADAIGLGRDPGQDQLGSRAVAVLAGPMMLDHPPGREPERIGEPRLLEDVAIEGRSSRGPTRCASQKTSSFKSDPPRSRSRPSAAEIVDHGAAQVLRRLELVENRRQIRERPPPRDMALDATRRRQVRRAPACPARCPPSSR